MSSTDFFSTLRFDANGLIAAIVQDAHTKKLLTLAYMSEESLQKTLETGETWFWSRSRQALWHKGATSGNTQHVERMTMDCDGDALLIEVTPRGPACHTGSESCFAEELFRSSPRHEEKTKPVSTDDLSRLAPVLDHLAGVIRERKRELPEDSYTTQLFKKGLDHIAKKVAEESAETILAAKDHDREQIAYEAADLLYHLLVLLIHEEVSLEDVAQELSRRSGRKKSDYGRP
jgi:phosphoribosyl-ATP pyrophosphohydrolase/phosphoribosyl-AMP cyclohydrolase